MSDHRRNISSVCLLWIDSHLRKQKDAAVYTRKVKKLFSTMDASGPASVHIAEVDGNSQIMCSHKVTKFAYVYMICICTVAPSTKLGIEFA